MVTTEINAARFEAIEMNAWEDIYAAAPAPMAASLGLSTHRFGPALAMVVTAIDNGQFNRVQGIGLPGDEDGASMDEALKLFRGAGLKNALIQIPPGPHADALAEKARGLGLVPFRRAWAKFARGSQPAPQPATDLEIVVADKTRAADFGAAAVGGFGMPPFLGAWLAALVERPGWTSCVSYDGASAVGAGAMRLEGDTAWLGIGATLPAARGRGGQSAILARRVELAVAAGARVLITETGTAVPGEPQTSYDNIRKAGFDVVYDRANWVLPG